MKKNIIRAIACFAALLVLWVVVDFSIYLVSSTKQKSSEYKKPHFGYITKYNLGINFDTYFAGGTNENKGRLPVGTQYKSKPIVVFGCSYAYGEGLNREQTFSYKLSEALKRPVYNRAVSGRGIQHMYMQLKHKNFFKTVPADSDYIYVLTPESLKNMYFWFVAIPDLYFNGTYSLKNNYLIQNISSNPLVLILKSSYITKLINRAYVKNFANNPANSVKITDMAVKFFTESAKAVEKKAGHKINFTVFIYDIYYFANEEMLIDKLEKNGFNVVVLSNITDEDLSTEKYMMAENLQPSEEAWNVAVPEFIKRFK